ncbi:acyltransferase family protein [Serratia proteamaculans]|uniref:acyltransferase family protein n=1 Tax=Serratia proteamaculans TaxID=28151 RepID=UPI00217C5075|nr:acyltransferase [Serratia proteamaculans]CAI1755457.1 Acyltransferase family [Serratia proteamaculans]
MINNKKRLSGLDGIRGILAIIVALSHSFGHFTGWNSGLFPLKNVSFSVDIFFVLSGIVLYHAHAKGIQNGSMRPFSFFLKRVLRLYPLHLATMVMVPLALIISCGVAYPDWIGKSTPINIFGDSILMNAIGVGFDFSSNQPSWSISVELYIGTLLVYLSCLTLVIPLLFSILALSLFYIYGIMPFEGDQYHAFLVNGGIVRCLFSMSLGILSYKLVTINKNLLSQHRKASFIFSIVGIFCMVLTILFFNLTPINYMILIIIISVSISILGTMHFPSLAFLDSGLFSTLGKRSFSIYLLHTPLIYLLLFLKSNNNILNSMSATIIILLTIHLSKFTLKYIENPFVKLSKRL